MLSMMTGVIFVGRCVDEVFVLLEGSIGLAFACFVLLAFVTRHLTGGFGSEVGGGGESGGMLTVGSVGGESGGMVTDGSCGDGGGEWSEMAC